ncbi:L-arabinokinase [Fagus crenata]
MKRKDLQDIFDEFSSRKSRRLDVDILQNMNEDPTTIVPQILEQGLLQEQPFISSGNMVQTEAPVIDSMPSNINSEERALVLYNPPNIPFVKSPSSPDFTIVVNSELIPGLKDILSLGGNGKLVKSVEKDDTEKNPVVSNDCLAVVPWVASYLPLASGENTQSAGLPEAMETEEVEIMDTDYNSSSSICGQRTFEYGGTVEEAGELHHWQHHFMQPHLLKNNSAPVTW